MKFDDLDADGINDGEPGLEGWTIELRDSQGALIATTVTDSDGDYWFTGLAAGTYELNEIIQPDWIQSAPAPD